jgi:hypothetical protein
LFSIILRAARRTSASQRPLLPTAQQRNASAAGTGLFFWAIIIGAVNEANRQSNVTIA